MRQSQRRIFAVLVDGGLSWLEEVTLKPISRNSCHPFKLLEVETASGGSWVLNLGLQVQLKRRVYLNLLYLMESFLEFMEVDSQICVLLQELLMNSLNHLVIC